MPQYGGYYGLLHYEKKKKAARDVCAWRKLNGVGLCDLTRTIGGGAGGEAERGEERVGGREGGRKRGKERTRGKEIKRRKKEIHKHKWRRWE